MYYRTNEATAKLFKKHSFIRRVFPPSTKLLVEWPYFILRILRLVRTRWMDFLKLLYIPLYTLAQIVEIFLTASLLWVCRRPGHEPTIFPSGEAAGSLVPLNAQPHLLRRWHLVFPLTRRYVTEYQFSKPHFNCIIEVWCTLTNCKRIWQNKSVEDGKK